MNKPTKFLVSITITHVETDTKLTSIKGVEAETWKEATEIATEESKILNSPLPDES